MQEIWKYIEGYEGHYQVSNLGNIKSFKWGKEKIIKVQKVDQGGHGCIRLSINLKIYTKKIHRIVAIHFIQNPNNLPCVCHRNETLDENGMLYNGMDNLFWGTHKDNVQDCHRKGRANNNLQLNHPMKGKFGKDHIASKNIYQYTKYGEFIKKWLSENDIHNELGISNSNISQCCNGKRKTAGGFVWKFE